MVLWWCIPCPPKGLKHPCYCISRLDLELGGTSRLCTASSCLQSGWLVPLHQGSHMHLGLPHPHIPPPTTPTGKLWDRNSNESVPGVSTGWGDRS